MKQKLLEHLENLKKIVNSNNRCQGIDCLPFNQSELAQIRNIIAKVLSVVDKMESLLKMAEER